MANNNFALHLFKKIKEDNKTNNIFYSPLSISSALAMVSLGAAGNTATQMSEVRTEIIIINENNNYINIHKAINVINKEVNKDQRVRVLMVILGIFL